MKRNIFTTLVACILHVTFTYSQSNHNSNISGSGTAHAEPLGWISGGGSVSNDLDIDNNFSSKSINLSTFNGSLIKRMSILSTGEVGIGNFTPSFKLDVDAGDININSSTNGYRIGSGANSKYVLWHNGNTTDIFVGVAAGNNSMSGHYNTIIGNTAGLALTSGYNNVALGYEALLSGTTTYGAVAVGFHAAKYTTTGCGVIAIGEESTRQNTTGSYNIGIGVGALKGNVTGNYNICVGWDAGGGGYSGPFYSHDNNSCFGTYAGKFLKNGSNNVFMGHSSGYRNTYGSDNVAIGYQALYFQDFGTSTFSSNNVAVGREALYYNNPSSTSNGINNTAVGYKTGNINETGYNNTFLGYQADVSSPALNNSTAIGANAVVTYQNSLVLGDKKVWSGIGLSGVSGGPQNSLEIIARDRSTESTISNKSGLRFRQLTSSSPTSFSSNGKVLTVDGSGDVVLTQDVSSTITAQNGLSMPGGTTVNLGGDLDQHTEIDLDNLSLTFDYTLNGEGYLGIGTTTSIAKLNVGGSAALAASLNGNVEVAASFESIEESDTLYGTKIVVAGAEYRDIGTDIAVTCGTNTMDNAGVLCSIDGYSRGESINYGGYFNNEIDVAEPNEDKTMNIGVRGNASMANLRNTGVHGEAVGIEGSTSYGVYGIASGVSTRYGIYGTASGSSGGAYAARFEGNVIFNGTLSGSNNVVTSDAMFKSQVEDIPNAMNIISRLQPKTYFMDTENMYGMRFSDKRQYGLIAQDVQNVLPELVQELKRPATIDDHGITIYPEANYKGIVYDQLFAIMLKGMQE